MQRSISDNPQGYRLEILHHVVGKRVGRAIDDVGLPMADAHGVTVRCGTRHAADTNGARGSRDVFNDHGLTKRGFHPLGENARERVGRPSRREGDDDANRA